MAYPWTGIPLPPLRHTRPLTQVPLEESAARSGHLRTSSPTWRRRSFGKNFNICSKLCPLEKHQLNYLLVGNETVGRTSCSLVARSPVLDSGTRFMFWKHVGALKSVDIHLPTIGQMKSLKIWIHCVHFVYMNSRKRTFFAFFPPKSLWQGRKINSNKQNSCCAFGFLDWSERVNIKWFSFKVASFYFP